MDKAKGARQRVDELLGVASRRADGAVWFPGLDGDGFNVFVKGLTAYVEAAMLAEMVHVTEYAALNSALGVAQGERDEARAERDSLKSLLDTPEVLEFTDAVQLEAAHQRKRWKPEDDAAKTDADWFWLIGWLAGKAVHNPGESAATPNASAEKRLHRIITVAAAACNWHAARRRTYLESVGIPPEPYEEMTP